MAKRRRLLALVNPWFHQSAKIERREQRYLAQAYRLGAPEKRARIE